MAEAQFVPMYDPVERTVVDVHPDDVAAAEEEGLSIETEETAARRAYQEEAGLGEAALALAEGTAKGATLGLSDVALAELGGEDYRRRRALREEEFSGTMLAGEVLGSVAPALLSGGTGAAAKAATFTPAGLASRAAVGTERALERLLPRAAGKGLARESIEGAARFGAAGVVEGGLAGAGYALSEEALLNGVGSPGALAERAWAGAKTGALFGLGAGGALGGGGTLLARGGSRLLRKAGDELAGSADVSTLKALGFQKSDFQALRGQGIPEEQLSRDVMGYRLKDSGARIVDTFDNVEEIAPKLRAAKEEVGAELGALRERVSGEVVTDEAADWVRKVDEEILAPLKTDPLPTIRGQAKKVESELADIRERISAAQSSQKRAADYLEQLDTSLSAGVEASTHAAVREAQEQLRVTLRGASDAAHVGGLTADELGKVRRVLGALGESPDSAVAATALQAFDDLGRMPIAAPVTHGELARIRGSLADIIYPKKPPGRGLPPPLPEHAAQLQQAERLLEGQLETALEKALARISPEDVGRYAEAKRLYRSFKAADAVTDKAVQGLHGNRAISLTDYISGAPAIAGGILTGDVLGMASGAALSAANKFARERGRSVMATLAHRVQTVDQELTQKLNGFFRRARAGELGAGGVAAGETSASDVRAIMRARGKEAAEDAYHRLLSRAGQISRGAGGPYLLDDDAPKTGLAMREVQMRAASHLLKHAPVPPRTTTNPNLGALSAEPRPDPVALYDFARRVRAIEKPQTLLADLERGTISPSAVEAVRDVYPELYASMQARVMDGLANSPKLLPYESRIRLGVLFQLPTDPTLRPEFLAATQSVYQEQAQPPTQGPQPGPPGARSKTLLSAAQELEAGDVPV
jgi:hypothetical protein